jgi:hypothetical protein
MAAAVGEPILVRYEGIDAQNHEITSLGHNGTSSFEEFYVPGEVRIRDSERLKNIKPLNSVYWCGAK